MEAIAEGMNVKFFDNDELGYLRAIDLNGQPWFVGKDVAKVLGYANARKAIIDHVDEEDRKLVPIMGVRGGEQETIVISQYGVCSLVFSCKLPLGKKLKRWITSEVMPKMYDQNVVPPETMDAIKNLISDSEKLVNNISEYVDTSEVDEYEKYKAYAEKTPDPETITVIARDYGWSARQLNNFLGDQGVQHKNEQDKRWYISKEYADKELVVIGFYVGENCTIPLVRWTVAGRMLIYDLMKKAGNKLAIKL